MKIEDIPSVAALVAERQTLIEARAKLIEWGAKMLAVGEIANREAPLLRVPAYTLRQGVDDALADLEERLRKNGVAFDTALGAARKA